MVNAGASRELLLSICSESALCRESARAISSFDTSVESERLTPVESVNENLVESDRLILVESDRFVLEESDMLGLIESLSAGEDIRLSGTFVSSVASFTFLAFLSSCEDNVKEPINSKIAAMSPSLSQ